MIGTWESLEFNNPADPELPMGIFMFTDEFIAFDHLYNTAEIVKLVIDGDTDKENNEEDAMMNFWTP